MAYLLTRLDYGADVEKLEGYHPGGVGTVTKRHYKEIGDEVSPSDFGLEDEDSPEWDALYKEGVVSDEEPPEDWDPATEPLNKFRIRRAVETLDATTAEGQAAAINSPMSAKEQRKAKQESKKEENK